MKQKIQIYTKRYFLTAMNGMALGLFSSLIINLIISQIGKIPGFGILLTLTPIFNASSNVVGAAIGVGIAYALKAKPMVLFSSAASGAIGYAMGGPVGAYLAGVVGVEIGGLVVQKTKIDIIVTPLVTIISGGLIAVLVGPAIQGFMNMIGSIINEATEMAPLSMGIIIAVVIGMALTAPISSAAICIMLGLNGIAAGAATVGCCAQMIGFAVSSYHENGWGGFFSIGIGTSMLQFSNILRRPAIWIAPTLSSAILGPISTTWLRLTNSPAGAGMGTSGLVGPIGTFVDMNPNTNIGILLVMIIGMYFIAPAVITLAINLGLRKIGWIKEGDYKLPEIK